MKYKIVAVGGTFDFLHAGHKKILRDAFSMGEKVIIGVTSDTYVAVYKSVIPVSPFQKRKAQLEEFLKKENLLERVMIIPLHDPYGPAIEKAYVINALLITKDTEKTGREINEIRKKKGLPVIDIILVDLLTVDSLVVSSSYIRAEIMNSNGILTIPHSWIKDVLFLPTEKREIFHKPFGNISSSVNLLEKDSQTIVTVGDVTTKKFHEQKIYPKISVIDFVVERKKMYSSLNELGFLGNEVIFPVKNPAGSLTVDVWKAVLEMTTDLFNKENYILFVDGEEDLIVLPLVIVLPVGFTIYYGQPHIGIIELKITEENKNHARYLLNLMTGTTRGY